MAIDHSDRVFQFDVFISYSRLDRAFAKRLKQALETYRPPKELSPTQQKLKVFLDTEDITGTELNIAIKTGLQNSRKLIVICSPSARNSKNQWIDMEIRQFTQLRGPEHIIPLLLDGIPNNEAVKAEQDSLKAFPEALYEDKATPLASSDYRGVFLAEGWNQ